MIPKIVFIDPSGKFNKWILHYFNGIDNIKCIMDMVENYKPGPTERVAYVSPLNNMGNMNSGIDLSYNMILFKQINIAVKKTLLYICNSVKNNNLQVLPEMMFYGNPYISVGSSILLSIDETYHYLVGAPTLSYNNLYNDTPKNAYYAFKAILTVVNNYITYFGYNKIDVIVVPALCCGSSHVDPKLSAEYIFNAYFDFTMNIINEKVIYSTPTAYIVKTEEYMQNNKLIELNKQNQKFLSSNCDN